MNRHVARLLVFLMVPVVVFTVSTEANAESWGTVANFTATEDYLGHENHGPGGWNLTCNGTAAYVAANVESLKVSGRVICDVSVRLWNDPDPGDLENGYYSLTFKGSVENSAGSPCTINTPAVEGDILTSMPYTSTPVSTRCIPSEVCVTAYAEDPGTMANHDLYQMIANCVPIDLGPIPGPTADQCPYGNVTVATPTPVQGSGSYAGYFGRKVMISIELTPPGNPYWAAGTPYRGWGFDAREFTGSLPKTTTWKGGSTDVANGSSWTMPNDWKTSDIGPGNLHSVGGEPKGIWIWIRKFEQAGGQSPGNGLYSDPQTPLQPLAKAHKDYAGVGPLNGWGANDPANCHFYIGPKFWNDDSTTLDEPFGTLATPIETGTETQPPPEELEPEEPVKPAGDCSFSFTDPTTWLAGGICELVKAVSSLISSVLELPARIWDAFKAGLEELFIPRPGFVEEEFDGIKDAFDDTTLGNYLDALSGLVPSGSTGCSGPSVNLNVAGSNYSGTPLSTCSGPLAQLATMTRLVITVAVYLGAGFACVRILGRSMGWDPQIGGSQ